MRRCISGCLVAAGAALLLGCSSPSEEFVADCRQLGQPVSVCECLAEDMDEALPEEQITRVSDWVFRDAMAPAGIVVSRWLDVNKQCGIFPPGHLTPAFTPA